MLNYQRVGHLGYTLDSTNSGVWVPQTPSSQITSPANTCCDLCKYPLPLLAAVPYIFNSCWWGNVNRTFSR